MVALAGCADQGGHSLAINLRTDFAPRAEFTEVRVFLIDAEGEERVQSHRTQPNGTMTADYLQGRRVGQFANLEAGAFRARVEVYAANTRRIGVRTVTFALTQDTNATVVISRRCVDVVCPNGDNPAATECASGQCVVPECTPENPTACGPRQCEAHGDCVAEADCATGICDVEGSCLFAPIADACDDGERCVPETGCAGGPPAERDAAISDAESTDAGPRDTGPMDVADAPRPDTGIDAGTDAGLPPECGQPCETGNPCTRGTFHCSDGTPTCQSTPTNEGGSCGETSFGGWSACQFDGTCSTRGTQNRTVSTRVCVAGACTTRNTPESRNCNRSTEGDSCGSVSSGPWSACGGFDSVCDDSGTRSRTITTPTCQGGRCNAVHSTASGGCTRNTNGMSCVSLPRCQRGTCSGGVCDYIGSPCSGSRICCEPGICISPGSSCP